MKKCIGFLATAIAVIFLAGSAQAAYVSNFNITQADFNLSGFSWDHDGNPSTPNIPTAGPDLLDFDYITGTYDLDIPPAGGSWDVYISGSIWADFDKNGTRDEYFDFGEYAGNYASPGPSTLWGPGFIPLTVEYEGTSYDFTLDYEVVLDGGYPSGSFGANAYAELTLFGDPDDPAGMLLLNTYLTGLDNDQGGADGVIDGWIGGNITVTAVPIPGAVWLFGSGLIGLVGIGRKFRS